MSKNWASEGKIPSLIFRERHCHQLKDILWSASRMHRQLNFFFAFPVHEEEEMRDDRHRRRLMVQYMPDVVVAWEKRPLQPLAEWIIRLFLGQRPAVLNLNFLGTPKIPRHMITENFVQVAVAQNSSSSLLSWGGGGDHILATLAVSVTAVLDQLLVEQEYPWTNTCGAIGKERKWESNRETDFPRSGSKMSFLFPTSVPKSNPLMVPH